VSTTCPQGHASQTPDYCSVCGDAIPQLTEADPRVDRCVNCGAPSASDSACGNCGFLPGALDIVAPWVEENWEIVVRPDRAYYERVEPDGMAFPDKTYSRRIPLVGDHLRIGRRSKNRAILPEIDLSGTLEDTGVSRRHAVLMRQPDGSWALVDQDSANGTYLNDDEDPIPANEPIPLGHGDKILLGGWTTLTIERLDPAEVAHPEVESRPSKDTRNLAQGRRRMQIDLLGPVRLSVQGDVIPITAPKERAVLAVLALRIGSTISTVDLEWALWGEGEPKTANVAVRGYITSLRKLLPPDSIEHISQGYRLNGAKNCVDVFRFERGCNQGRALLASGHPGAAVAWLDRALQLWRGEPLLDLADGPTGATETVSLNERRANAEDDLFEGRLQLGEHEGLVADLRAAVGSEPLRQRRWAQLMLALYRSGRQSEALSAFQRYHDLLVEEYGLEPSAELVALDRAIATNSPELQWTPPTESGEKQAATVA
jgi:DNA-binding SARP family transcriptional activator